MFNGKTLAVMLENPNNRVATAPTVFDLSTVESYLPHFFLVLPQFSFRLVRYFTVS